MQKDAVVSLTPAHRVNSPSGQSKNQSTNSKSSHQSSYHPVNTASWWLDFYTMAGRKSENQDSLLVTTCLGNYFEHQLERQLNNQKESYSSLVHPVPLLILLADGVSASQFPKQASRIVVETVAEVISEQLASLYPSKAQLKAESENGRQFGQLTSPTVLDDDDVASLIKTAVISANDAMYFSQAYQRVPPLLSTLSGVLCVGDRIHLFHTGDSRIYRIGSDSLTQLSVDHRIHHGQDKGALSAALGADARIELQQSVFTLHQNEYLALMTDGVYEHIEATELQYELNGAVAHLEDILTSQSLGELEPTAISQQLCGHALSAGSNDNLSAILVGIDTYNGVCNNKVSDKLKQETGYQPMNTTQYQIPTGLNAGDNIDGFIIDKIIARTARSEVYLVHDSTGHEYVLKSPSLASVDDGDYLRTFLKERKIGLSLSKHRRAGESAYNQANPNRLDNTITINDKVTAVSSFTNSGLLRYFPVPASSPYLYHLTEYVAGESLRMFMERQPPCDVWQTYDLLTKIGMAVRVMHRNYLLHQDIKPENIILSQSGGVKLIDFGSVSSSILKDNTRPPVGDLHYAAPEYYTDAPKGVHSDLFSIAVIGFELLTGELPFTSQMLMSASDTLKVPTQLLQKHKVPATSQQALLRALHRSTNARHQAIGEFLQDFNPDNRASLADPEPLIKRNPLLVWHGICLIQFIIIVLLLIKFLPAL